MRLFVVPDILKNAPVFAAVAEVGSKAQSAQKGKRRGKGGKRGGGQNLFEKRAARR